MKRILTIETIDQYNSGVDQKTFHPLVSIVDFSNAKPRRRDMEEYALKFKFYCVFLKDDKNCVIRYGRNNYDYQKGTLVFIAPEQIISIEEDEEYYQPKGYALLFHPDLIRGTSLASVTMIIISLTTMSMKPFIYLKMRNRLLWIASIKLILKSGGQ